MRMQFSDVPLSLKIMVMWDSRKGDEGALRGGVSEVHHLAVYEDWLFHELSGSHNMKKQGTVYILICNYSSIGALNMAYGGYDLRRL